ncbi:MAG: exodeoxyribonuclease VII large subunit [Peptoniphilaceae bacterium]|nr:exodeoxyribonuclease VII large subunit [Peptoniphilaceae bacterium]MDY6019393.1 exodeoxyribonuclease VII large subunit [Anaerococcus sp.]
MRKALSVKQFNEYIKSSLKHDPIFQNLHVKGQVANYRISHEHLYFSLKEGDDIIDCVIYYYIDKDINTSFDTGDEIEIYGNLLFNNYSSRLVINITKIEEFGISEDYKIFIKLRENFQKKGYFDSDKKKEIPKLPKNIGLITSKDGAAVEDYLNVINQVPNDITVSFYPVKVQGKNSIYEIIKALDYLDKKNLDLLVITRGGGSKEDLNVFNSPEIVEKVFSLKTPLISAIGHKIDQTLIDLVADLSLQTPTEAASVTVRNYSFLLRDIDNIYTKILKAYRDKLYLSDIKLSFLKKDLYKFDPKNLVKKRIDDLNELNKSFEKQILDMLNTEKNKLNILAYRLKSIKKMLDIEKNKIQIKDMEGREIFSKFSLKKGQDIKIIFSDGEVLAIVKDE